jgi:hypothetical protein
VLTRRHNQGQDEVCKKAQRDDRQEEGDRRITNQREHPAHSSNIRNQSIVPLAHFPTFDATHQTTAHNAMKFFPPNLYPSSNTWQRPATLKLVNKVQTILIGYLSVKSVFVEVFRYSPIPVKIPF